MKEKYDLGIVSNLFGNSNVSFVLTKSIVFGDFYRIESEVLYYGK